MHVTRAIVRMRTSYSVKHRRTTFNLATSNIDVFGAEAAVKHRQQQPFQWVCINSYKHNNYMVIDNHTEIIMGD